ncbi:Sensor protein DivL [compost metagenome]
MINATWFAPALLMNASAIWALFLLSWAVARRHRTPYFVWWTISAGFNAVGALLQALDFMWFNQLVSRSAFIGLALLTAIAMIASARRFRGESAPVSWWKWGLGAAAWAGSTAMLAVGVPLAHASGLSVLFMCAAHVYFGWTFWPRHGERVGLGAPIVAVCSIIWGLHILDYPLVSAWPAGFAMGYWFSAMLHLAIGTGMIIHLFEQSQAREEALGRQLQQTNQALLRTVTDLTDSRSQAEVSAAIAREQEALVRQIVHDLRNATQAISLIMEDVEAAAGGNSRVEQSLAAMDRQVRFISNFLKEKLAWIVDRRPAPGGTELAVAFEALQATFAPIFASKGQTFVLEPAPAAALRLSPVQFEQVVGNLLRNAHQHCPPGTRVRLWTAISDGWATVYVSDDGPGIPLSAQGGLGRSAARANGTGIGLANVHDLVTAAGGLFGLVSEEGRGSTFYATLPLAWWGLRAPGESASAA